MGRFVYYKLFDYMNRKGLKDSELVQKKIISAPTLLKLKRGERVQTDVLAKICEYLNLQPGDIMEYEETNF